MRIAGVKYLFDYQLQLKLNNGTAKKIDLENFLKSSTHPLITKYRNKKLFSQVYLDECGVLCWGDNEMDINPESIFNDEYPSR